MRVLSILFIVALYSGAIAPLVAAPSPLCPPLKAADNSIGSDQNEYLFDLQLTADGGFIAVGSRWPVTASADVWVVKGNATGHVQWERTFGGTADDSGTVVIQTRDGGYAIGASSASNPGGSKSSGSFGAHDFWLIRLDASGDKLWEKSFGGSKADDLRAVVQTDDGGFLLGGDSSSPASGTKTSPYRGDNQYGADFWIVRTDVDGNQLWDQSYGGTQGNYLEGVSPAADGGFLLAGSSSSGKTGNKTVDSIGGTDFWIVRIDRGGGILWQRTFGGTGYDYLHSVASTGDGGFLLGGDSQSEPGGTKSSPLFGYIDAWLVRIDAEGQPLWEASFGGQGFDSAEAVHQLADGGFIFGGVSGSLPSGNKSSPWHGGSDYWMVRLNGAGEKLWDQSYGGLKEDTGRQVQALPNGGFLLAGSSESRTRGNKTSPLLGGSDFWLVRLAPETPGDCDSDGVPDSADACPQTPFGDIVDAQGCGLAQACPCDGAWPNRDTYQACVESTTANFLGLGLISAEQRQQRIAAAMMADCPPTPASAVVYGLTNVALGDAVLDAGSVTPSFQLSVSEIGPLGSDGVSVRLGEADSGVFLSPYASIWGEFNESWFMDGSAYGRVDGLPERPISRLHARKPDYGIYPVKIDLSPLAPISTTFQVWSNSALVAERTIPEAIGEVTVRSTSTMGPRANPFWRMPDGSVGAMIELTELKFPSESLAIDGPFGEGVIGNRIFVRADSPSQHANSVSRLDVVVGGGLGAFSVLDARPGVFRRAHRVIGPGVLLPLPGRLHVTIPIESEVKEPFGTLVELREEGRLDLTFEPIRLTNTQAQFSMSLHGWGTDDSDSLGALAFGHTNRSLVVTPSLNRVGDLLETRIYRRGVFQGTHVSSNANAIGMIAGSSNEFPGIIGSGVALNPTGSVFITSFTLDRVASFQSVDGVELQGDHFQIVATNAASSPQSLSAVAVWLAEVPALTITGETSDRTPPPLAIVRDGSSFALAWPAYNGPFVLETSDALPGAFTHVTTEAVYRDGHFRVDLPAALNGNRFFRLRTAD